LLHVPVTKSLEEKIDTVILGGLSFADEKVVEIVDLTKGLQAGRDAIAIEIETVDAALAELKATYRSNDEVRQAAAKLSAEDAQRNAPFANRLKIQEEHFNLPVLPTTTIGSLPQTPEVRRTRTKWRKAEITDQQYEDF